MRKALQIAVATYLSLLAGVSCAFGHESVPEPSALFPIGRTTVKVHALQPSEEAARLSARVQAAARQDPEWYQEHVRSAAPGEPVAYDKRIGLSEAEFARLLEVASQMELVELAQAEVEFEEIAGGVRLIADSDLPDLNGIVINWANDKVDTPYGTATERSEIHQSDPDMPTGAWHGLQWKFQKGGVETGNATEISLAIGRRVAVGDTILYYRARQITAGRVAARADRILTFQGR